MEIWIDTTKTNTIERASKAGLCYGITTNPSILCNELGKGESLASVIKELLKRQDGPVAVQVTETTPEGMLAQAKFLTKINPERMIVKVPVSEAGLASMNDMICEDIRVMATAICQAYQYILVAEIGVEYAAPYINNILTNPTTGLAELQKIANIPAKQFYDTKLIGGAIKSIDQFVTCAELGIDAVTLGTQTIDTLLASHTETANWVSCFSTDWENSGLKLAS